MAPVPRVSRTRSRKAAPPIDRAMIQPSRDQSTALKKPAISAPLMPRADKRPDDGPHRGPGDGGDFDAVLFEPTQHADVGEALGRTTAESQGNPLRRHCHSVAKRRATAAVRR